MVFYKKRAMDQHFEQKDLKKTSIKRTSILH